MIDLEQERKAFEEQWRLLGGHLLYVEWSTDNMYSLSPAAKVLNKNDQISLFNTINTAWGLWVVQAKQNKTVIDSLKAKLAKVESGEYVVVPKSSITQFWQDNEEPENFCNKESEFDCLGDCVELGEIMEINKHYQAHLNTEKTYGTWVMDSSNPLDRSRSRFFVGTKKECEEIILSNELIYEESKEPSHD